MVDTSMLRLGELVHRATSATDIDAEEDRGLLETFGPLLRAFRIRANLTQGELGKAICRHQTSVGKLETGERRPPKTREFYLQLQQALGLTELELTALLRADGAVQSLIEAVIPPRLEISVGGITMPVYADRSRYKDEELDDLEQRVKACLVDFVKNQMPDNNLTP